MDFMRNLQKSVLGIVVAMTAVPAHAVDPRPSTQVQITGGDEAHHATVNSNNSVYVNLRSGGNETGVSANPLVTTTTLSFAPELASGRLFSAAANVNAASAGSDNGLILFRNPVASGVNVFVFKVIIGVAVANVAGVFKVFTAPTTSAVGSTLNAYTLRRQSPFPSPVSLLTTLPTVTSLGNHQLSVAQGQNSSAFPLIDGVQLMMGPGTSFLITADPSSNNRVCTISLIWSESPI